MNQNANFAHCGAMLRSGQYDWVLAEITQDSEWVASQRTDLASVRSDDRARSGVSTCRIWKTAHRSCSGGDPRPSASGT